jgi:hypothetical protein
MSTMETATPIKHFTDPFWERRNTVMRRVAFALSLGLTACASTLASPAHAFGQAAINYFSHGHYIPVMNQVMMRGVLDEIVGDDGSAPQPGGSVVNLHAQEIGWPDLRRMELTQAGFRLR